MEGEGEKNSFYQFNFRQDAHLSTIITRRMEMKRARAKTTTNERKGSGVLLAEEEERRGKESVCSSAVVQ